MENSFRVLEMWIKVCWDTRAVLARVRTSSRDPAEICNIKLTLEDIDSAVSSPNLALKSSLS